MIGCADRGEVMTRCTAVLVPRVLPTAARLLGDVDGATRHWSNARERAARLRLPSEEAYRVAEGIRLAEMAGHADGGPAVKDAARRQARELGLGLLASRV